MVIQSNDTKLDMITRRKLADLAYRESTSDAEMLCRLIDRAYDADLRAHPEAFEKPSSGAPGG